MMILAPLFAVAVAASPYQIDLGRYFPNPAAELASRGAALAALDAFETQTSAQIATPRALADWLGRYDALSKDLQKHDIYVYLRAEEDGDDKADAAADETLSLAIDRLRGAATSTLGSVGDAKLHAFIDQDASLRPYGYFIDHILSEAAHDGLNQKAVNELAKPALDSFGVAYKTLRQQALAKTPVDKSLAGRTAFEAKWAPYLQNEAAFAAVLLPLVAVQNGKAKLQGYADAPQAAYARAGLSSKEVDDVLAALRASDSDRRYHALITGVIAQKMHVVPAEAHSWDWPSIDAATPPPTAFPAAAALVLAAVKPMGAAYARQYADLLEPAARRVDWCNHPGCDKTGFSVGYAGAPSGLFYGAYDGSADSIRAVAHEAGHAAHRQFMTENQPLAVYNEGPHFLFESFAIFNELLLLDHLSRAADAPQAKAFYLHQFLEDITFQIYGSAEETDLEQSIYAGAQSGQMRSAADLDQLTLAVFGRYEAAPEPETKVYWARNRLYFTDPLYDANYLFAGLLALEYWRQYEADPQAFSRRYVALLKAGMSDSPQALERRFLDIDLDDAGALVGNATHLIDGRTAALSRLYATAQ